MMSQYDYIKDLAKYGLANDQDRLQDTLNSLIDYSVKNKKNNFATQLQSIVKDAIDSNRTRKLILSSKETDDLILQTVMSSFKIENLICTCEIHKELEYFVKEHRNQALLKKYGIPVSNKLILHGPSGCGKTLAAYVLAGELEKPLMVVNLGSIVSSKLGETSKNITKIFKEGSFENAIIFFDEFDSIGKIRDYNQDHGEMKRVVNTLLQLFDYLQQNSIVIAATNQLKMIDPALLRRFDISLELKLPNKKEIDNLISLTIDHKFVFDDKIPRQDLVLMCRGLSYYVIKRTLLMTIKRTLLNKGTTNIIDTAIWSEFIKKEQIYLKKNNKRES